MFQDIVNKKIINNILKQIYNKPVTNLSFPFFPFFLTFLIHPERV